MFHTGQILHFQSPLTWEKSSNATIVPETKQTLGMLRKVKDIVAWCSADTETILEFCPREAEEKATNQSTRMIYLRTIQI